MASEAGRARVPGLDLLTGARASSRGPISRSRVTMAAKAAVAGAISWYLAQLIPGASAYAYYAPFGAVIAMAFSIADSIRQCVRAVGAIAIGAGLALGSGIVIPVGGGAVALIVFLGLLMGGWRRLGTMGGWIPMTALFVLIIGDANPGQYVGAYVGLTLLGGVVATGVNLAIPPMPVASYGRLENRIRKSLAEHVDGLAHWLDSEDGDSRSEIGEHRLLSPMLHDLWSATDRTADAQRVNPRAPWHASRAARQYDAATRLERLIYLAQEITQLVAQGMQDTGSDRLDDNERLAAANCLRAYSTALRWADSDVRAEKKGLAEANASVRGFADSIESDTDWLAVGLVVSVRRSLQALLPEPFRLSDSAS